MFVFLILLLVIYCEEIIKDKQLSVNKDICHRVIYKEDKEKQIIVGMAYISNINMMKYP